MWRVAIAGQPALEKADIHAARSIGQQRQILFGSGRRVYAQRHAVPFEYFGVAPGVQLERPFLRAGADVDHVWWRRIDVAKTERQGHREGCQHQPVLGDEIVRVFAVKGAGLLDHEL